MSSTANGLSELPAFPASIDLGLDLRSVFDEILSGHPPYSDTHFSGLWFWDVDSTTRVSRINENLIIEAPDYESGKPTMTLFGVNDLPEAIAQCMDYLLSTGRDQVLRRIPLRILDGVCLPGYVVAEDTGNADYILSTDIARNRAGGRFRRLREQLSVFDRAWAQQSQLVDVDLDDGNERSEVEGLFHRWDSQRLTVQDSRAEWNAFQRCLEYRSNFDLVCVGLRVGRELVAVTINERLHSGWSVCHFQKSDSRFRGSAIKVMVATMARLLEDGVQFCNLEQDLGIPGLRQHKKLFSPIEMLSKVEITRAVE